LAFHAFAQNFALSNPESNKGNQKMRPFAPISSARTSSVFERLLMCTATLFMLAGCNGFGGAIIGGTVSGLSTGASVVLQNNGAESLTVSANGSFQFVNGLDSGQTYSVVVTTQPTGQTCTIANPSGSVDSATDDVTSIAVSCTTTASLGGTVTGLAAGTSLTLSNAGTQLIVAANGEFAFPGILAAGTAYNVTIVTQPAGHNCTLAGATGAIVSGVMSSVTVTCT
jgi:hypothetical protein